MGTASPRTLQKDRAILRTVFEYAVELELREGNPVAKVRVPKPDPRPPVLLTPPQFEGLLSACEDRPVLHLYVLTLGDWWEV